jgi:vacuolar-type H+-ATPase subunit C/Vma6
MARWEDVNARVSGLASRLIAPDALAALARAQDLQELSRTFAGMGLIPEEIPNATAPLLELALRRKAGHEIALIRRWLGSRIEVAVALDAEDRRSLRALVRGAAAGAPADARLTGLLPTPTLPERLLRDLASRSSIREQAALLVAAGHPSGPALLEAAAEGEPDLFAVELAISRAFAERARRAAGRGGSLLREYVGDLIDGDNCRSALLLAGGAGGDPAGPAFIEGGRRLTRELFERSAATGDPDRAARQLGRAFPAETSAALLRHADAPAALEAALEAQQTSRLTRAARCDPLGPAPLLLFFRRLRTQAVALGEQVWRLDLQVASE